LDSERRVLLAIDGARRLLAEADGLTVESDRIAAWRAEDRAALARAVAKATAQDPAQARPGFVRVARASGRPPLALLVAPSSAREASGAAAVVVRAMGAEADVPPQLLIDLFDLTPAEARVAAELVKGRAPQEIADGVSVSLNTIRNQLQHAYRKIGVSRQSALVTVVLSAAAFVSNA
jgi:DNA-binding CsgD family transcriptional regulator